MACGTPVITTPTGLAAEMGPGAPLLMVAPEPGPLALGIDTLLSDPDAATARARAARTLMVSSFGWERVVGALERIYQLRMERAA
jgi:glycosyltransferase involved in cell wall biosynthesis